MARGTIAWRCWICGTSSTKGSCPHPGAKYYIAYRLGPAQKWEPVSRNKKEAELRLAEIMTELRRGTFRLLKPIFFKEFSERWLKDYAVLSVKPLTLRFYRTMVRSYLNPVLGNLLLSQITPHRIQILLASYQRERHLSAKTLRCLLTTLKTMLKHAKQWNHLRENPAEGVKPPRLEEREMDFLHPGEIQLLLKHSDEPHRTLFLTAILTGMRRGELLGLQWGDIDWHNNLIHVRRSLYWQTQEELAEHNDTQMGKWRFSTPKSKNSVRRSVMSQKLREALELHQIASPRSQYDLVFCTKDGQPIHAENMLRREFFPALRRAGLRRIRFHDLRHTYTTLLIAQGENVKFIQSQLGHASIETTLDRYGHLLPEDHGQVGERLDALVFGCDNGRPRGQSIGGREVPANGLLTNQGQTGEKKVEQEQKPFDASATYSKQ